MSNITHVHGWPRPRSRVCACRGRCAGRQRALLSRTAALRRHSRRGAARVPATGPGARRTGNPAGTAASRRRPRCAHAHRGGRAATDGTEPAPTSSRNRPVTTRTDPPTTGATRREPPTRTPPTPSPTRSPTPDPRPRADSGAVDGRIHRPPPRAARPPGHAHDRPPSHRRQPNRTPTIEPVRWLRPGSGPGCR